MNRRRIGSGGPEVSAIGFGCTGMSFDAVAGERYAPQLIRMVNT